MPKKKKGKLPKHVLGVKVPKELRKAGEKLIEQAQGPAGRQAIAGAVTAIVGAAASAALARGAKDSARQAGDDGKSGATAQEAHEPGDIIRNMVNTFVDGIGSMKRS